MERVVGASPVRNDEGVISVPPADFIPDPRGLGCAIFDKMVEHKKHVAQADAITGENDTYESLLERCIRTAIAMRSSGVTSEDIISICSYTHLNTCVPYLATLFLGAKIACLDPDLCLSDTIYLLNQLRPKMIFIGLEAVKLIEDAIRQAELETEIVVFGHSTVHRQFSEFLVQSPEENQFQPVHAPNIKETAIIVYSGGTTGLPKGVCMSHSALLNQAFQLTPNRRHNGSTSRYYTYQLTFASVYWISTSSILLACTLYRVIRVVYPKFDVDDFWSLIERSKVDSIIIAPSHVQNICGKGRPEGINTSHLKQVFITGGPVSKEQIQQIRSLLPDIDVVNLYGTSEAGGYVMSFRPHIYPEESRLSKEKPDSCGRPRQGIACRVVDNETGEVLAPYLQGELRIKSDFQMSGYYGRDSSGCWDADGWLKSGEVAYYDEDNCFYIVDRMKEMLTFRTWRFAPAKLEGILHSHPAVETAVVVGLPHPEDGQHPVGVVVLRPSAVGVVTAEDLEFFVEQRVEDKHRLRGGVRIVDYIPITPTGKTRRRDMRELVLKGEI